jgi:hypothetical protein
MRPLFPAFLFLIAATPAIAETSFSPFAGPSAARIGDGGTSVVNNGIDFWIMGTPARPYRVLGTLTDLRSSAKAAGDAVDSKPVADAVRAAGGEAAILVSRETRPAPQGKKRELETNGNAAHGTGWSSRADERVTTLVVIRYSGE